MNENELPKPETKAEIMETAPLAAPSPATVVEPDSPEEICVVARNPQEMMAAQSRLIAWAVHKHSEARQDYDELAENHSIAVKNKWRADALGRQAAKALKRAEFYEKILGALEAGYVIVPNLPIDVFAIRTERAKPKRNETSGKSAWIDNINDPRAQESERPALGIGEYVNPETKNKTHAREADTKPDQQQQYHIRKWADSFKEIEFPFATARPEILDSASHAMALRLFDDIGVSPSTKTARMVTRMPEVKGDPMIVGRVLLRKNAYQTAAVSFLIAWWVNTKELP